MQMLAQFAFADYSRGGTSVTLLQWYRTDTRRSPVRFPAWGKAPYWASRSRAVRPSDWEQWTELTEVVPQSVMLAKAREQARCRFGEVRAPQANKRARGVIKTC
jgi:hypothetical protein